MCSQYAVSAFPTRLAEVERCQKLLNIVVYDKIKSGVPTIIIDNKKKKNGKAMIPLDFMGEAVIPNILGRSVTPERN